MDFRGNNSLVLARALFLALALGAADQTVLAQAEPSEPAISPPKGLRVLEAGLRKVILAWTPSSDSRVAGYVVYRQAPGEPDFRKVATVGGWQSNRFTDQGKLFRRLADQTAYRYSIAALAQDGQISRATPPVQALTKGPPQPVRELTAEGGPRKISLRWQASTELEVVGYEIWRAEERDAEYSRVGKAWGREQAFFLNEKLQDDTPYFYMVTAINKVGLESPACQPVLGRTKKPPRVPRGLRAQSNMVGQSLLAWEPNQEANLSHYEILRSKKAGSGYKTIGKAGPKERQYIDLKVKNGTLYYYSLLAIDLDGLRSEPAPPIRAFTKVPPLPPTGFTAHREAGGWLLEWNQDPDPHVRGYIVYQRKHWLWREIGRTTQPRLKLAEASEGTLRFRVSAFLDSGLEGKPTAPLKLDLESE